MHGIDKTIHPISNTNNKYMPPYLSPAPVHESQSKGFTHIEHHINPQEAYSVLKCASPNSVRVLRARGVWRLHCCQLQGLRYLRAGEEPSSSSPTTPLAGGQPAAQLEMCGASSETFECGGD